MKSGRAWDLPSLMGRCLVGHERLHDTISLLAGILAGVSVFSIKSDDQLYTFHYSLYMGFIILYSKCEK